MMGAGCSTPAGSTSSSTSKSTHSTASTSDKTSSGSNRDVLSTPAPEPASSAPGLERTILDYINEHRKSKGLKALVSNGYMTNEARNHSLQMARKVVPFGHQGLSARTQKISQKIENITSVSENVARGKLTARQVVDSWLKSPGHRKNIEGNYTYTGLGVARDQRSELYFTQIFAK